MKKGNEEMNRPSVRRSNKRSPFIIPGEFLKEISDINKDKNKDKASSIYNFENFEFLKLGEKLHVIGSGSYCEVYLSRNKIDKKFYAIKKMDKKKVAEKNLNREMIMREINTHRRLIHENIVRLYSYHEDEESFYLILDYAEKGTLIQQLKFNDYFEESLAFKYFIQVVTAVHFLHENNLIHRDLKPENLLLDEDENVRLCDFGWCVEVKVGNRETFCGTYDYMAPEIIKEMPYNSAVDVWSLGVLLFELLHGYPPFRRTYCDVQDFNNIFKNILQNKFMIKSSVSENCKDLIKSK